MRAFQVGTVSARAVKCGFNFDPAKLKTTYLAYERQQPGAQTSPRSRRIYDVSFNGVAKAVAAETDYCTRRQDEDHQGRSRPPSRRRLYAERTAAGRAGRWTVLRLGKRRLGSRDEGQASHGQQRLTRGGAPQLEHPAGNRAAAPVDRDAAEVRPPGSCWRLLRSRRYASSACRAPKQASGRGFAAPC